MAERDQHLDGHHIEQHLADTRETILRLAAMTRMMAGVTDWPVMSPHAMHEQARAKCDAAKLRLKMQ